VTNDRTAGKCGTQLVLLAFALAVVLVAGWYLRRALLLIYVSAIFAVVLKPGVDRVHERGILGWRPGRGTALMFLIGVGILLVGLMVALAVPPIAGDVAAFAGHLPERIAGVRERLQSIPALNRLDLAGLQSEALSILGSVQSFATGMANGLLNLLTALLLVAYLILEGNAVLRGILSTVPGTERERLAATLQRAGLRMRGWLTGQLILMLILGVSSGVVFGVMGVPYFLALAVFAAVANIVPMLGPLLTVLVAGLVAATDDPWKLLGVAVFYLVYQQVENAFLTPMIMKAQVQLSSAVVVLALIIGGELAGIAGALVAVPTAVLVIEIAGEYLVQDRQIRE
jgi:predicted PurR-regulated permease PerM